MPMEEVTDLVRTHRSELRERSTDDIYEGGNARRVAGLLRSLAAVIAPRPSAKPRIVFSTT